jgi:hypothetical protein
MNLTLPPHLRTLPNDARLNAKELAQIMGCTTKSISRLVSEGKFPAADGYHHKSNAGARKDRHLWSMGLLRSYQLKSGC